MIIDADYTYITKENYLLFPINVYITSLFKRVFISTYNDTFMTIRGDYSDKIQFKHLPYNFQMLGILYQLIHTLHIFHSFVTKISIAFYKFNLASVLIFDKFVRKIQFIGGKYILL